MYKKFIITDDGLLKFGHVHQHRDLLEPGEQCSHGGGMWAIDNSRCAIVLYGRSFDFGPPEFSHVTSIDWSGIGGKPVTLLHLPHWPKEDLLVPMFTEV